MTSAEFRDIYDNIVEMFGNRLLVTMIANGVSVTECGVIEKITDSAVVMRADSGRVRFFSISSIFSMEPAVEYEKAVSSEAETEPSSPDSETQPSEKTAETPENDPHRDEPAKEPEKYSKKDYSEEIGRFIKENAEAQKKSNQIVNILSNAKKNRALSEKEGRLCMALKDFLEEFGNNRSACLFAADIYEQMERYGDAIAVYKFCGETDSAKYCAHQAGDPEMAERIAPFAPKTPQNAEIRRPAPNAPCTGRIENWSKEGIYGFLWSDQELQGTHRIFFHLSSVKDEALRTHLYRLPKLTGQVIPVTFFLGKYNGQPSATRIQPAGTFNFNQAPQAPVQIRNGFLAEYNRFNEFGRISDGEAEYNFFSSASRDPYLLQYLQKAMAPSNIDVCFTLKKHKDKYVVDRMAATEKGRERILSELGTVKADPAFEAKSMEELLTENDPAAGPMNVPAYRELPLWTDNDEDKRREIKPAVSTLPADRGYSPLLGRVLYDPKSADPCQQGQDLKHTEPEKAEKYFLDALQRGIRVETALPSLIDVYNRIKDDPCEDGFPLLDYFGINIDSEKLSNLRISMLQKAKRHEELIKEIDKILPKTYNTGKRKHFLLIKAISLNKLKQYAESITVLESYKKLVLPNGNHNEILSADRLIATNHYLAGNHKTAKQLAEKILAFNANDSIASAIIKDEVQQIGASNLSEYGAGDIENDQQLKGYPKYKLDSIILDTQIAGVFKRYIKDNKIVGDDLPGLSRAFSNYITDNIRDMPAATKDNGWAFLAKVTLQLLEENSTLPPETLNKFMISYKIVNLYAGRAMMSSGDYVALSLSNELDTLRFFYTQTLNLVPEDQNDATNAFNRMVCSFYAARDQLSEVVRRVKEKENDCWEHAGSHVCSSLRSLFITTFLLDSRSHKRIRRLLECLLQNNAENRQDILSFGGLWETADTAELPTADEYYNNWLVQKNEYLEWLEKLQRDLNQLNYDFTSIEAINRHIAFLQRALERKKLLSLDESNIGKLVSALISLQRALSTDDFDTDEEHFKSVIAECESLGGTIEKSPTNLSFEFVRESVNGLKVYATEKLDELYAAHCPKLSLSCRCGYQTNGTVPVYFSIQNDYNKQTAEIQSIDFHPNIEGIEIKKSDVGLISRVKSGEAAEGMRTIVPDPGYGHEYVEFTMSVSYTFRSSHEAKVRQEISVPFHFELRDNSQFIPIGNPYHKYALGGAVVGDMFRGRDDDINKIIEMLKNGPDMLTHRGIVMYGQKRAGKSSILENLRTRIQQAYGEDTYLFIEVGSIGDIAICGDKISGILSTFLSRMKAMLHRRHSELYKRLLEDGVDFSTAEIEADPDNAALTFNRVFGLISEKLEEYGGPNRYIPMFFVDEFTYIYQWIKEETDGKVKGFPHFWKAFLQNNRVCSIIIGQDNMPVFTRMPEYANDFGCMEPWPVTYLKEAGARGLIEDPLRKPNGTSRFDEAAVQMMLKWTAGSAYLIVWLCDELVSFMNELCHENVTALVLTQFLRRFLCENHDWDNIFDAQITDPSKVCHEADQTAGDNKLILSCIACSGDENGTLSKDKLDYSKLSQPTREYRDQLLEALLRRDVLIASGEQEGFKIKVDLLRIVLRHQAGVNVEEIQ